MLSRSERIAVDLPPKLKLPVSLLTRYLFFLTRRPISQSNTHYLQQRLDGLKSLGGVLQDSGIPDLDRVVQQLRVINPGNFQRMAERLQYDLLTSTQAIAEIPWNFVVSNQPPRPHFWLSAQRILLLFGPAIGVGDEIIAFPLPAWIKAAHPRAELSVLSAYDGLWHGVNDVDHVLHYTDHLGVLKAIRGETSLGPFDLVMLVDFERPDLHQAICYEPGVARYVELSLGAQSLVVVDNRAGWLYRAQRPIPYFANYYLGLDYLVRWLGLTPETAARSTIIRRASSPPDDHLQVYVNPYTSKYDPSPVYWSHLLSALFPEALARHVHFVVDPGPNAATAHFATALVRSASARVPAGIDFEVARPAGEALPSFQNVFAQIEWAHAVICSDSFTAHAASLFDCTTLVVARPGLENWRVPHPSSYYFSTESQVGAVIAGMRQVLQCLDTTSRHNGAPPISTSEHQLERATRKLHALFNGDGKRDLDIIQATYGDFLRAYQDVVERLPHWPAEFHGLWGDVAYEKRRGALDDGTTILPDTPPSTLPSTLPSALEQDLKPDMLHHIQDRFQQWENTNLRKYLGLLLDAPEYRQEIR